MATSIRVMLVVTVLALFTPAAEACDAAGASGSPEVCSPPAPWRCQHGIPARRPVISPTVVEVTPPGTEPAPAPGTSPGSRTPPASRRARPWLEYAMTLQLWDVQALPGKNFTRVRRFENKFTLRPARDLELVTMLDLSRRVDPERDVSHLQDAYARWQFARKWRWIAGQFKIPFSEEALRSSSMLDTIERAQFNTRADRLGNLRELGTMVEYRDSALLVQLGAFSGEATNKSVGTDLDQAILRCVWMPAPSWSIGGALGRGSRPQGSQHLRNTRQGLQVAWSQAPWLVEVEWAQGLQETATTVRGVPVVLAQDRSGWYGKVRYDVNDRLQLVLRVDDFYPNTGRPGGNGQRDVTVGLNYWLHRSAPEVKLQANYVNRHSFTGSHVPDLLRTNLQVAF